MGTDDRRTVSDRQAVFVDLASTVQTVRGGDHAREMAAAVFRHATGSTTVVGLVDGCGQAVFYDANTHSLTAVPVDEHGLDRSDGERLLHRSSDPTAWVDARANDIDWAHPRYRWVLDGNVAALQSHRWP